MKKGEWLFDKRIVERNISKGLITQEEYEKHIKTLEDKTDHAEVVVIEEDKNEKSELMKDVQSEDDDLQLKN